MAKVFPGGSSITRVFPPELGDIPDGAPKWVVDYEVDFTAHGAHDFKPGGDGLTKSLGGVTWTADACTDADDYESVFALQDGVGLVITLAGVNSDWAPGGSSTHRLGAPRLTATVPTLSPAADENSILAFQAVGTSSPDISANYDSYGLVLSNGGWTDSAAVRRVYNGAKKEQIVVEYADGSAGWSSTTALSDNNVPAFHEMCLLPGGSGYATSSGRTYPAWPMTGDDCFTAPFSYDGPTADWSSLKFEPSNLRAGVLCFQGGSTTTLTITWTAFRVLRLVML